MSAAIRVRGLTFSDKRVPPEGPYCCLCFKLLTPRNGRRWVWMTEDGCAVHADDVALLPAPGRSFDAIGSSGGHFRQRLASGAPDPIGYDCARRISFEWSRPDSPAPTIATGMGAGR